MSKAKKQTEKVHEVPAKRKPEVELFCPYCCGELAWIYDDTRSETGVLTTPVVCPRDGYSVRVRHLGDGSGRHVIAQLFPKSSERDKEEKERPLYRCLQ